MGLDIYCRWGATDADGNVLDGMTVEEYEAQFTGFVPKPEVGYLRYSWGGAGWVRTTAAALGVPSPIRALFPGWEGSNGEVLAVTPAELERLRGVRAEVAAALDGGFVGPVEADGLEAFKQCLRDTVGFINFVEAHADRPGLRIEFD